MYSDFERYIGEAITPSMYHFMSQYPGTNAEAVQAYFDLPLSVRISMHEQTLANLRAAEARIKQQIHEEEISFYSASHSSSASSSVGHCSSGCSVGRSH
jgi:hypothetical protein